MPSSLSVLMLGATGAVGSECARALVARPELHRLTTLGRRPLAGLAGPGVAQHVVDVFDAASYGEYLPGHDVAICTFGVGQPSQVSHDELVRVDKTAVLHFARACRAAGVRHFELLSAVGADAGSRVFYLRTKGELEDELRALQFGRLSLFRPSMILTPTNRYGLLQGLTLAVWPRVQPLFIGGLRKYRGVPVEVLGRAMAMHAGAPDHATDVYHWDEIASIGLAGVD